MAASGWPTRDDDVQETEADASHTQSTRRLREALLTGGHRCTSQRMAVYRVLSGSTSHPTADEIFASVRETIPDISLATVYKALETLVSCGLARKLFCGTAAARYDGRMDMHYHARCLSCGAVVDVDEGRGQAWLESLQPGDGFEVIEYRLELTGYCRRCQN